jgi:TolB-like protein
MFTADLAVDAADRSIGLQFSTQKTQTRRIAQEFGRTFMAAGQPNDVTPRPASVFLSYASEDRQSVQAIRDALPGLGLDVWYDESELGGGEAWDQKIRRQIRECDFFMPVISARTEARAEGYFRREWRFAVERTLDMADDHVFLVPIVIDGTVGESARVPEKFLTVQWMRLPGGKPTPVFEALCRRLASGETSTQPPPQKKAADPSQKSSSRSARPPPPPPPPAQVPEFPRQEPGQNARFYGQAAAWTVQSAWIAFQRLPKWIRIVVYCWVAVLLLKGCDSASDHSTRASKANAARTEAQEAREDARATAQAAKIKAITEQYMTGPEKGDIPGMVAQIARQFSSPGSGAGAATAKNNLLAIPFTAPSDDQHAKGVAGAVFGQLFGKAVAAWHGQVRLSTDASLPADASAAAERGRAEHSTYVVYGSVDNQSLNVKVIESEDGSVEWSKSYPLEGADTAKIAAEVQENIPED